MAGRNFERGQVAEHVAGDAEKVVGDDALKAKLAGVSHIAARARGIEMFYQEQKLQALADLRLAEQGRQPGFALLPGQRPQILAVEP